MWTTIKDTLDMVPWTGCSGERIFCQQRSSQPKSSRNEFESIRLIYSSLSIEKTKLAEFHISEVLLFSCNHVSNRYKMHMIEKKTVKEDKVKGKKRRALEEELGLGKKKKRELESIAQRLIDTADKKAKEAEKQKNAS